MHTLGVLEARKRFPELLERVREGEETLISRHGHPSLRWSPCGGGAVPSVRP